MTVTKTQAVNLRDYTFPNYLIFTTGKYKITSYFLVNMKIRISYKLDTI